MITRIKESEASALSAADVARYLETGKINVVYRSRSILEIGQCADAGVSGDPDGYKVVFKYYEPLGCGDCIYMIGVQHFAPAQREAAIASFLERLRNNPEESEIE